MGAPFHAVKRLIYTTNAIENFNRQLRKVTKTKSTFVSDDALMKNEMFYGFPWLDVSIEDFI